MTIRFTTFERLNSNNIDVLELSERASNSLKRAGILTIGGLCEKINEVEKVRSCGVKTVREIKNALFNYELQNAKDPVRFIMNCEVISHE